jgi:hypothetical protein
MATFINPDRSIFATDSQFQPNNQVVIGQRVVVHTFNLGDVDDPSIDEVDPVYKWEKSEAGQWVMTHSTQPPTWFCNTDHMSYGYKFIIVAWLSESDYLFFKLKF